MEIQPSSEHSQILVKNFFKSDCEDCEEDKNPGPKSASDLTTEEQQIVNELRTRDQEVRAHEQAHQAAAGGLASGPPSFTYEIGPDGKRYAVGGEVQIDTSEEKSPEATIRKAQVIKRAASAPALSNRASWLASFMESSPVVWNLLPKGSRTTATLMTSSVLRPPDFCSM